MTESGEPMDMTDLTRVASVTEDGPQLIVKPSAVSEADEAVREVVFSTTDLGVYYGAFRAVRDINLPILKNEITALIGPSGCGKTTFLRCLNRMNDLIDGRAHRGHARSTTGSTCTTSAWTRSRCGGASAWSSRSRTRSRSRSTTTSRSGRRSTGTRGNMDELVEESLRKAALWDEVKDKLKESGLALSGGQQQRLCIARAIAIKPDVILMDEPCSALDPIATAKIEDLMQELVADYTIVIVTHNMQQAARVSDRTAFFTVDVHDDGSRTGTVVEFDRTESIFTNPADQRTEDYVTGRFG